jgi:hypothetical protein
MPSSLSKLKLARAREDFAWQQRVRGYTERSILEQINQQPELVPPGTKPLSSGGIHKILVRAEQRVLARIDRNVETLKVKQTLTLENNIEDLRKAYETSTQAQVFQKQKTANAAQGGKSLLQNEVGQKTMVADHSILGEMRQHLAEIRKIWGADAPLKTDATITGAMQVGSQDLSKLSDAELQTLLALQQKLSAPAQDQTSTPEPTS